MKTKRIKMSEVLPPKGGGTVISARTATVELPSMLSLLVEQLRELGATVYELTDAGLPTLLVGFGGKTTLLDVSGAQDHSTSGFIETWRGGHVKEVATLTQACRAMGLAIITRRMRARKPKPDAAKKRAA